MVEANSRSISQGDVLVALGKAQAAALTYLRAATPFSPPGTSGTVPTPYVAPAAPAAAPTPSGVKQAASDAAGAGSPTAGRRNLVHKAHRTHKVRFTFLSHVSGLRKPNLSVLLDFCCLVSTEHAR